MSKLQISFFGSSLLSSYWNGAATYYRGILKALYKKGYRITFFEPDAYDRQKHRDINKPEYAKCYVFENSDQGVRNALSEASNADIIIKASGIGVYDEFLEREVLNLKNSSTTVFFWDVDAPATLDRIKADRDDPFNSLIPHYDGIFTYGGGKQVANAYLQSGAKHCHIIYNALDSETHFPVNPDPRFECKLGFLGNRLPDREQRVIEFFSGAAQLSPEYLFIIGGNGWDSVFSNIPNIKTLGHVFTHDHNSFNSTCFTVLNINRQSMVSYGYSPPTRIFEAAGAGACIITDNWEGIEHFLTPLKECLVVNNKYDVVTFLKDLDLSQKHSIGKAARERILTEHTYQQRAEIVDTIFQNL